MSSHADTIRATLPAFDEPVLLGDRFGAQVKAAHAALDALERDLMIAKAEWRAWCEEHGNELAENQRLRKKIERIDNVRRSDGSRVYKLAQIGEIAREALAGDGE